MGPEGIFVVLALGGVQERAHRRSVGLRAGRRQHEVGREADGDPEQDHPADEHGHRVAPADGSELDDDDRPRNREPKKKSNAPIILLVVGGLLLMCCGGAGYGIYYAVNKIREKAEQVRNELEKLNLRVNRANYDRLTEAMTPNEVESILGPGTIATRQQVLDALPEINKARIEDWGGPADNNRVVLWRNGDDILLCCFYPSAKIGLLQRKTFQPASGFTRKNVL